MKRTPERIEDELLVLRCQAGDRQAMAELAERWQRRLLSLALRLTGDREAAYDAVQDAWVAIVRGIPGLRDPARFPHWALRIAGNKSTDWVRRQARRRAGAGSEAPLPPAPAPRIDPVREAIRRLPPEQQAVLVLKYLEDLTVAEIAGVLGVPAGTVKSRLHHAREALRRILEKEKP